MGQAAVFNQRRLGDGAAVEIDGKLNGLDTTHSDTELSIASIALDTLPSLEPDNSSNLFKNWKPDAYRPRDISATISSVTAALRASIVRQWTLGP